MSAKRYYWLKLKEDFFDDEAIEWLEEQENGKEYALLYLKLCLKSLKTDGVLIRRIGDMLIPYDAKKVAEFTKTDFDTVVVAMELLKKIGLIEILENGEIFMTQISKMVGSETDKAATMRRIRENKKGDTNKFNNVTHMLPDQSNNVTHMLPDKDNNVDTEYRDKSIEYRDKSIEYRDKSIEKENKRAAKAAPTPFDFANYPDLSWTTALRQKFLDWLEYKKERREGYKPIGLKNLVAEINRHQATYGEQAVIDLMTTCMASGYRGIIWDKLEGSTQRGLLQPQPQATSEGLGDMSAYDAEWLERVKAYRDGGNNGQ